MSNPLLMVPGPVLLEDDVVAALARPALSHHDPDFLACYDDCVDRLRAIFDVEGRTVILPGSGRLGLEALITSTIRPGDRTLHLVNGFFAAWMVEIARRAGAAVTVVESAWDQPLDPGHLEQLLSDAQVRNQPYALVTAVHSETATGLLNPAAELAGVCNAYGALLVVDAISSLGCTPLSMRMDGIHLCGTASQKGLAAPMGLSTVAVSDRALALIDDRDRPPTQSFALDLARWERFFTAPGVRPYPVAPSTHLVFALQAALRRIAQEGLHARIARHARIAAATRAALTVLGLRQFAQVPTPTVSGFLVPDGLTSRQVVQGMLAGHQIQIAAGMGPAVADRLIRIAHIGAQATVAHQLRTLEALAQVLVDRGHTCSFRAAEEAFQQVYTAAPA